MECSSKKEFSIKALRGVLSVLSSGIILCASVPFGNPVALPMSGKVNAPVKIGMLFCGSMIHDFSVM